MEFCFLYVCDCVFCFVCFLFCFFCCVSILLSGGQDGRVKFWKFPNFENSNTQTPTPARVTDVTNTTSVSKTTYTKPPALVVVREGMVTLASLFFFFGFFFVFFFCFFFLCFFRFPLLHLFLIVLGLLLMLL